MLYGLGVTIGAGIYVLVGETVARAGPHAPAAFLLSALVMAFTAGSFAELAGRVPQAAGEAVYAATAFRRNALTTAVGLAVLAEALIAAAAIALGAAGYVGTLVALPGPVLVVAIVAGAAAVAGWGIRESVAVAGAMTLVEVLGLILIIWSGLAADPAALADLPALLVPPPAAMPGVLAASLIAFFAFIGFDDIVNLVEEARAPQRDLPRAIAITLALVTVLYVLVAFVAVRAVPPGALAGEGAPMAVLFRDLTGLPPLGITLIAILATLNGVVIILIMAARVAYGMARAGRLPGWFGHVAGRTRTPVRATAVAAGLVLVLALAAPLEALARSTSAVMLTVFCVVNLSLVRLKRTGGPPPAGGVTVPMAVPVLGAVSCLGLLVGALVFGA